MAQLIPSPYGTKPIANLKTAFQTFTGKTFTSNFKKGSDIFDMVFTDTKMIQTWLINWFLTNKGERVMFPTFGANLRQYLFEAIDDNTFEILEMKIKDDLSRVFPMITLLNLKVLGNEEYNEIKVSLTYFIESFNTTDVLNIMFASSDVGLVYESPDLVKGEEEFNWAGTVKPNKIKYQL
tara:strand:- start:132 stop:671 length:540 start_codon:yes stop_codon:yes gene_type:complete